MGPRTTRWVPKVIRAAGFTPMQRHFRWRSILCLQAVDAGVDEHHFLSELLEAAGCFDQLNCSELLCVEMVCRRYQLWEEVYSASLREADAGAEAGPWMEERVLFQGGERSKGHALVCPALESWAADQLQCESAILMERRKGREERLLAMAAETDEKKKPGGGSLGRGRGNRGRRQAGRGC